MGARAGWELETTPWGSWAMGWTRWDWGVGRGRPYHWPRALAHWDTFGRWGLDQGIGTLRQTGLNQRIETLWQTGARLKHQNTLAEKGLGHSIGTLCSGQVEGAGRARNATHVESIDQF